MIQAYLDELERARGDLERAVSAEKRGLLADSAAILARLRKSRDGEVVGVVELMDRFGVGLEQEALPIERM